MRREEEGAYEIDEDYARLWDAMIEQDLYGFYGRASSSLEQQYQTSSSEFID